MKNKKIEYLIIGAGVTGLTFANYCNDDYLIVEKENEVGGYCRTIYSKDYVWDFAGHFFHFKTDEFKQLFLNNISKKDLISNEKCTKILYKNKLIDYPFQTNIHQLDKDEFIDCLYDLFNKNEKLEYDNFLDMLYGKFGKSITEKFLKPYNEKLYAIDLKKLDKDAMGRFFPYADKEQIIKNMKKHNSNSYNDHFMYLKNGAGSFMNILYKKLDTKKILLNSNIIFIDINNKYVELSDGQKIYYNYLINTSPFNKFLKLFMNDEYYSLCNKLSYNKVLVFNLGFSRKSKLINEHWIYIPSKERNYYRIGFYDNILKTKKLSMYVEIGYNKDYLIDEKEIQKQLKLTINNLNEDGIIDSSMILEDYVSIIMDPAYVHINNDVNKLIGEEMKELNSKNIFSIGRYGSWTYCSIEDCMIEAKKLAEYLKGENK